MCKGWSNSHAPAPRVKGAVRKLSADSRFKDRVIGLWKPLIALVSPKLSIHVTISIGQGFEMFAHSINKVYGKHTVRTSSP